MKKASHRYAILYMIYDYLSMSDSSISSQIVQFDLNVLLDLNCVANTVVQYANVKMYRPSNTKFVVRSGPVKSSYSKYCSDDSGIG